MMTGRLITTRLVGTIKHPHLSGREAPAPQPRAEDSLRFHVPTDDPG